MAVSLLTLAILALWPRVSRRIPAPFVALVLTTALVHLAGLPVETIGSRFGRIQASFPHPTLPHISLADARALVAPAFTIAALGAIESLLSAVVADGMIGGRHRANMELVAQGVANVVVAAVRRHARDGRHRPHRDQRQERRPDTGRGHRPRPHASR